MVLGKSQKPLTILCHPDIAAWDEIQKLGEQGHTIWTMGSELLSSDGILKFDLILDPRAWRMDTAHRKYVKVAVEAARKIRYPKEK